MEKTQTDVDKILTLLRSGQVSMFLTGLELAKSNNVHLGIDIETLTETKDKILEHFGIHGLEYIINKQTEIINNTINKNKSICFKIKNLEVDYTILSVEQLQENLSYMSSYVKDGVTDLSLYFDGLMKFPEEQVRLTFDSFKNTTSLYIHNVRSYQKNVLLGVFGYLKMLDKLEYVEICYYDDSDVFEDEFLKMLDKLVPDGCETKYIISPF